MSATVDRLIDAAIGAMEGVPDDFTDEDVLSACFTITLRMMAVTRQRRPDLVMKMEEGVRILLLQCGVNGRVH